MSEQMEITGDGPHPGRAVVYSRTVEPPLVTLRVERGESCYLAIGRFKLPSGDVEIVATVPRAVVERARVILESKARQFHTYLHRTGEVAPGGERAAALAVCGAMVKRQVRTIARDPMLAKKLMLPTRPVKTTARAVAAYRQAALMVAAAKTPAGAAALRKLAARAKLGQPDAVRAARIVAIVQRHKSGARK